MYRATRLARLKNATPPWADLVAIQAIYSQAERVSVETGVQHEVDHFYPLVGRNSCGLHVQWNLRIIPSLDNKRKSNKSPEQYRIEVREFVAEQVTR